MRFAVPGCSSCSSSDSCCARCTRAAARRSSWPVRWAVFTSAVRARTNPARARITVRSVCAFALRCFTGHSNCGSIRASLASVCASSRSSFFRLSPNSTAPCGHAPRSLHAPTRSAPGLPRASACPFPGRCGSLGMPPNTSFIAFGVVPTFCSSTIVPASSSTQYQLVRSPRSNPIVSFG